MKGEPPWSEKGCTGGIEGVGLVCLKVTRSWLNSGCRGGFEELGVGCELGGASCWQLMVRLGQKLKAVA